MSVTFTKLFSSITESTVWCEPHATRIVWISMLAMADKHGRVWGSIPGLANRARVTLEECQDALECFLSPDRFSRTEEEEGRRIAKMDGGWRLINYDKYREVRDEEQRKEYKKLKQREYRGQSVDKNVNGGHSVDSVDTGAHNAEAEAEAEKKKPSVSLRGDVALVFDYYLEVFGRNIKKYGFSEPRYQRGLRCYKECLKRNDGDTRLALEAMQRAVDGLKKNKFLCGANDRNKSFIEWDKNLFKNVEQMEERWMDYEKGR